MKLLFVLAVLAIFALAFGQESVQVENADNQPEVLEIQEDEVPRFKRQFGYGQFGGYGRGYGYGGYPYGGGFGRPRTVIVKKVIIRGGGSPFYG